MKSAPEAPVDGLTGLQAARLGVYIHFPYCLSKCPYCDFASLAVKRIPQEEYTQAMLRELERRIEHHQLAGREVTSVFVGGGTPSLWEPRWLGQVLDALAHSLSVSARCEVTLEANPGASDAERFADFRALGVNRLSLGVQSFQPSTLAALGRGHDGPMAERAFDAARKAGFENMSVDLIYGVHGQTEGQVVADVERAAALGSEHLSAYALTLDKPSLAEEVPLAKQLARGEVQLPADDAVVQMQRRIQAVLASKALHRYEISNYAKTGFHSRHNALYWTGGEYLALGAGATGFLKQPVAFRYFNHRSDIKYMADVAGAHWPESHRESLLPTELFEERLAMGLRLVNGVDVKAVCEEFEQPFEPRMKTLAHLERAGLVTRLGERVALTPEGFDIHSALSARLL